MAPEDNKQEEIDESEEITVIVDQKFIDRTAKTFSDSIESGDLYKELKGGKKKQ